ncbi:UDP-N-acetylmuramate dehydrogenase [bacterium]|nr:UDP-N-acetylmuramate dehydrogenase [bacterium]MBT3795063.1 UDP-N-acetylmuramate dehydrogenase [bacterium]MBT4634439.1 UDP-N-acetylmuramate dehydrogenase [bacterium]
MTSALSSKRKFNLFEDFLIERNIKHFSNYDMSQYASWRVGAVAPLIVYPKNLGEFINVIKEAKERKIKFYLSGNGSNCLFVKLSETIIISTKKLNRIKFLGEGRIVVESGASLNLVLNTSLKKGFVGFEFSTGIPGTIGGALITNAGANGGTISESLESVFFLKNNKEIEVQKNALTFGYRHSSIRRKDIVTKAKFKLTVGDTDESRRNIKKYIKHRNGTQPVKYPSAGSVFMNMDNAKAGKIIEDLGLKGLSIGGAKVSELHANYIINTGNAKIEDIKGLIEEIQEIAKTKEGILLSTEVKIINE